MISLTVMSLTQSTLEWSGVGKGTEYLLYSVVRGSKQQQQQFYLVPLAPRTSPWLTTLPATPALLTHSTSLRFLPLTTRVFIGLDHTCDLQHHIRISLIIFLKLPLNVQRTAQSFFIINTFFLSLLVRTSNGQDNHP